MSETQTIENISDSNFNEKVINSSTLSLVDFWAPWCGPCRQLGPTLEKLAETYAQKMHFFKMNVDENPTTPSQFHILGIPTIIFFKAGQKVDQLTGNQPKSTIEQIIQKHL